MRRTGLCTLGTALLLACSAGAASAWPVHSDDPASDADSAEKDAGAEAKSQDATPLGGPKVSEGAAAKTLVQRDFDGALKLLEGSPEEAAIDLLELDEETKVKVDKVFAERAKAIDSFTMENLDLIQALAGARQSGDTAEARKLLREALPKLGPIAKQGRLKTQVALVLPSAQAAEFTTLVEDYYAALVSDQQRQLGKGGEKVSWLQATARVTLQELGQEIRRSFYRQVGDGQERLESLIATLGLSPEQESKVRKMVQDYAIENKFKANGPGLGKLIAGVMAELEPDQRKIFIEELLKERADREGNRGEKTEKGKEEKEEKEDEKKEGESPDQMNGDGDGMTGGGEG